MLSFGCPEDRRLSIPTNRTTYLTNAEQLTGAHSYISAGEHVPPSLREEFWQLLKR